MLLPGWVTYCRQDLGQSLDLHLWELENVGKEICLDEVGEPRGDVRCHVIFEGFHCVFQSSLYKTVVDDVISNVKEAFLDEGVDEQVLQELKQVIVNYYL